MGSGGPANYYNAGLDGALASLKASYQSALGIRGEAGKFDLEACFGLAGLDSRKDMETMSRAIGSIGLAPRSRCTVVNDWRTALAGAFIDEPGVVLIAGTGCVAAVQDEGGRRVLKVGGWGPVADDRGSAYDIGREALYAAMRCHDGRGPKTALLPMLMRRLKVREPEGIIQRVYAERMTVTDVASLCSEVSAAAEEGDPVATRILEAKAGVLGELVVSAAAQLGMLGARFGVSPHGGVFRAGRWVLEPLEKTIHASAPLAELVEAELPPACGAVVLLLRRAGVDADARLVEGMRSSFERLAAKPRPGAGPSRRRAGPGPSRRPRPS